MKEIRYLLGDSADLAYSDVRAWAQKHLKKIKAQRLGTQIMVDPTYETACALLYNSRLLRAQEEFQKVYSSPGNPVYSILSRLGHGYALNLQLLYSPADNLFNSARKLAEKNQDEPLTHLCDAFKSLNQSDSGFGTPDGFKPRKRAEYGTGELGALRRSFDTYIYSRKLLRSGRRQDGLNLLEELIANGCIDALPPILKGQLIRMRGIFLSVSGQHAEARQDFTHAIEIFDSVSFDLGTVRTVLSLARTHAPKDGDLTRRYIEKVKGILECVEPPSSNALEGIHMPGEWASFYSRRGDWELFGGNLERAKEFYTLDHYCPVEVLQIPA